MKNEVKRKMNIDWPKSRYQSHDEQAFMAEVNQILSTLILLCNKIQLIAAS
jgi:hypothetical protein